MSSSQVGDLTSGDRRTSRKRASLVEEQFSTHAAPAVTALARAIMIRTVIFCVVAVPTLADEQIELEWSSWTQPELQVFCKDTRKSFPIAGCYTKHFEMKKKSNSIIDYTLKKSSVQQLLKDAKLNNLDSKSVWKHNNEDLQDRFCIISHNKQWTLYYKNNQGKYETLLQCKSDGKWEITAKKELAPVAKCLTIKPGVPKVKVVSGPAVPKFGYNDEEHRRRRSTMVDNNTIYSSTAHGRKKCKKICAAHDGRSRCPSSVQRHVITGDVPTRQRLNGGRRASQICRNV